MNKFDIDSMGEDEVRDLLRKILESLDLAEAEGVFGNDSWQGFLEIED